MSQIRPGLVQSLAGTSILNGTYTASSTVHNPGLARRVRYYVRSVINGASSVTTVTVKLTFRYNDYAATSPVTLGYMDLPSHLNDVAGAAQPKGPTFEVDHAFTVTTGNNDHSFYLDVPAGVVDVLTNIKGNAIGHASDSVKVYAALA